MYKDVNAKRLSLHSNARDYLFKHYRTLKKIFSDVLGLLEVDYLAIALVTPKNQLLFLSSQPSIECNLIEHNLWQTDKIFNANFFLQNKTLFWDELYSIDTDKHLLKYKKEVYQFGIGLSIPDLFGEYRVVYSFALKSSDELTKKRVENNLDKLVNMGRYCLQNIFQAIPVLKQEGFLVAPQLKLVINNQVNHENNT